MGAVCWSTSPTPGSQNCINTSLPQVFLRNVATILTRTLTLLSLIFSQVALTSFNNTKCVCVCRLFGAVVTFHLLTHFYTSCLKYCITSNLRYFFFHIFPN